MRQMFYRLIGGCLFWHRWKQEDLGDHRTRYTCEKCGKSHVVVRAPGQPWKVE